MSISKTTDNAIRPEITVLITGGSGYLASALRQRLVRLSNIRWLTMTRSRRVQPICDRETIIYGDAWSIQSLPKNVDVTLHLAGLVGDGPCQAQPALAERLNVEGTQRIHELAYRSGTRRFIFVSTTSIYDNGKNEGILYSEETMVQPKATYGQTKLQAEQYLPLQHGSAPLVILRFPAIIGWSPTMRSDTFANKFFSDGVRVGKIQILANAEYEVWRPVLALEHAMQALLSAITAKDQLSGVWNIVSENQPVRTYAERTQHFLRQQKREVMVIPYHLPKPSSYRVKSLQPLIVIEHPEEYYFQEVKELWSHFKQ